MGKHSSPSGPVDVIVVGVGLAGVVAVGPARAATGAHGRFPAAEFPGVS
jgi:hypothetical protein